MKEYLKLEQEIKEVMDKIAIEKANGNLEDLDDYREAIPFNFTENQDQFIDGKRGEMIKARLDKAEDLYKENEDGNFEDYMYNKEEEFRDAIYELSNDEILEKLNNDEIIEYEDYLKRYLEELEEELEELKEN